MRVLNGKRSLLLLWTHGPYVWTVEASDHPSFIMVALWNTADHYIFMLWFLSTFFFFFLSSANLSGRTLDVPYFDTWCGPSVDLECRSETYCARLAVNAGPKNRQNWQFGHHRTNLSGYIFATEAHVDNRKKNLLSSNISFTCPHNIVNFGPLTAKIDWRVWGTPSYFNGYRVLASLLHGTLLVGVSQTLRRWTD